MSRESKSKRFIQKQADSAKDDDPPSLKETSFTDVKRKKEETDHHTVGGF